MYCVRRLSSTNHVHALPAPCSPLIVARHTLPLKAKAVAHCLVVCLTPLPPHIPSHAHRTIATHSIHPNPAHTVAVTCPGSRGTAGTSFSPSCMDHLGQMTHCSNCRTQTHPVTTARHAA